MSVESLERSPVGRITELRLTAFKSYRDVTVPLEPLTVLIGRNGSGKSNALDALEVLSRLARGDEVRDAMEGNRADAGPIRGGLDGAAPDGSDVFRIGVSLTTDAAESITLDVDVQVRPQVQVVRECLSALVPGFGWRNLLETFTHDPNSADIEAGVWNNKRGPNPRQAFRASRLLTAQLPVRLPGSTKVERQVLEIAQSALAALSGVFHLDPVPHLMRNYVAEQDVVLRRTGENLSAAVARMKRDDKARFDRLVSVVAALPEYEVRGVDVRRGGFGDVMLAMKERRGRRSALVPARQMSDGLLRMLAIATALLSGGGGLAIERTTSGRAGPLALVIEELENGLHPSQAARLLDLVAEASRQQGFQVAMTTHSPALLNALSGDQHRGVLVIERDRQSGLSSARRLVDLPGYTRMMVGGRLGDAAAEGRIADAGTAPAISSAELDRLLGAA